MPAATPAIGYQLSQNRRQPADSAGVQPPHWWHAVSIGDWLMIPVVLVALVLRTQQISTVGLQCDESFIQKMAEFSWGEMFDRIALDTHPPLFHVLFKIWTMIFGTSVAAGRALAVLLGMAAVVGTYAFIRRAYHQVDRSSRENFFEAELPAIVAATILAMTPLQIFWSLQIRMYSLAVALTAWSSYFLVRALFAEPARKRDWAAYTLVAALLAYSHHFGLFVIAAQYVYAIAYRWFCGSENRFDRLSQVFLSGACLFFLWEPGLVSFLQQREHVSQGFYLPKPGWPVLGSITHELWVGFGVPTTAVAGLLIAQALFVVLLVLALGRRRADYLVLLSAVIPVISAIVISWLSQSILNGRYFLLTQFFFIAAAAIVACRIPGIGRCAAIGLLLWGIGAECRLHCELREAAARLPGMQAAVARIDAARGDEPLIVCNPMLYTSALMYTRDRSQTYLYQPPGGFPFFQGTAVIRDEEYADSNRLDRIPARFVWTMDADDSMGRVLLPKGWKLVSEERYPEWYVNLIMRLYAREPKRNAR